MEMSEITWKNIENGKYDVIMVTHPERFNAFFKLEGERIFMTGAYSEQEVLLKILRELSEEKGRKLNIYITDSPYPAPG